MEIEEIKALLNDAITLDELHVSGENGHYQIIAVSPMFGEMSRVKQQQAIYAPLNEVIASGAVHAVSIKAFTPEKWQREQLLNPIG
ncbi:BolA family protein [Psychrobium sp. 1_MG-2023]|uniref:BolA family protein n=1 Tax=Psychrobium sp. 1_MG-2023 TaxID=3062624 RepID=UPI000C3300A8|nr:BolA family protein [Psychrobium sp. 1_MG-2023]MDP2560693.1 BolA family protein [Psychrobium sp. 1_MG-2023]PKF56588.1 cell division protein BolA [Alteromonadales bacterium alter-6D02]